MELSQSNMREHLLTSPARMVLLTASGKEEHVLAMNSVAASMDLSIKLKREMGMSSEAMNFVCNLYNADSRGLEEFHEASAGK